VRGTKWLRLLAVLLALVLTAAACGGSDDDTDASGDDGAAEDGGADGGDGEEPASDPEPTAGFDGTTIKVGAITPTSGRVAIIGTPLTNGNKVFFDQLNAQGGIAGKYPVEVVVRDSKYESQTAIQEYNATKGDVVMYTQILGTPVVNALLPQLDADGIVAAPASLDAFWVREQHLLPIGGPYQIQVINGVSWYVNEGDGEGKKICSLTQDDPYGETGQQGLEFVADDLGIELGTQASFTTGNADYTTQINQLQGDGCEAVVLVATPADAAAAIGKAAQGSYAPKWLGLSPTWLKILFQGDLKAYAEANVLVMSEGPNWGDESVEGMVEMTDAMAEFAPDQVPDPYFAFGYNQAKAIAQVLEAAVENGDLSHEGIVEAMNGLDELTFGDLLGDYEWGPPEDRNPPRTSTIFRVDIASATGLTAEAVEYTTEAAKAFEFE
jgi:ABC-type branched-subunit amino acid transport system substrate-binding protein